MCNWKAGKDLIVLNLYSISISKIVVTEFINVYEYFNVKANTVKHMYLAGTCFQTKRMFEKRNTQVVITWSRLAKCQSNTQLQGTVLYMEILRWEDCISKP